VARHPCRHRRNAARRGERAAATQNSHRRFRDHAAHKRGNRSLDENGRVECGGARMERNRDRICGVRRWVGWFRLGREGGRNRGTSIQRISQWLPLRGDAPRHRDRQNQHTTDRPRRVARRTRWGRRLRAFRRAHAFNGTLRYPPGKLVEVFQRLGIRFGPDLIPETSVTDSRYSVP
jgi:hypothetical protein